MGIFMGLIWRAFWTTNGCGRTTLWWVKCKRLRNAQIKFPWKHSRASKTTGEKHSGHVDLRLYISLPLSRTRLILFSSPKHFSGWPHLLWSACCQARLSLILARSGWPNLVSVVSLLLWSELSLLIFVSSVERVWNLQTVQSLHGVFGIWKFTIRTWRRMCEVACRKQINLCSVTQKTRSGRGRCRGNSSVMIRRVLEGAFERPSLIFKLQTCLNRKHFRK